MGGTFDGADFAQNRDLVFKANLSLLQLITFLYLLLNILRIQESVKRGWL